MSRDNTSSATSPSADAAEPECERCGLAPADHHMMHWCDNQSFRMPDGSVQLGAALTAPAPSAAEPVTLPIPEGLRNVEAPKDGKPETFAEFIKSTASHAAYMAEIDNGDASKWALRNLGIVADAMADALAASPAPQPQALIPQGFGVAHHGASSLLTDDANVEGRFTVHRIEPPFADRRRNRSWQGPTIEIAIQRACEALEIPR